MSAPSDQELVRGCLSGDERCVRDLLDRYEKPVFNLALRVAGNRDDAEDITQAAFIKIYENLSTYDPRRKFFSWMYRIALNEALNFQRARKETTALPDEIEADDTNIQDSLEHDEHTEHIETALLAIHEDLRSVVVLHYFSGCSYADISYILDIPERTVKSRLYEARARLRRLLNRPRPS